MGYGFRAALKCLVTYYDKYGLHTLNAMIQRWAPEADGNNPKRYARYVAHTAGTTAGKFLPHPSIDRAAWVRILVGMAEMENGSAIEEIVLL